MTVSIYDPPVAEKPISGKPIGAYLIEAGLLSMAQVDVILTDQQFSDLKFGEIAALRGWIKQQTIEYLVTKVIDPERYHQNRSSMPTVPASVAPRSTSTQKPILLPGQQLPKQPLPRDQAANSSSFVRASGAQPRGGMPPYPKQTPTTIQDTLSLETPSSHASDEVPWVG